MESTRGREPIKKQHEEATRMLFEPIFFAAGGTVLGLALLDKALESYGFHALGAILKVAVPIVGLVLAVYFLETNALLRWLR
jgi:hypothetical protein